MKTVLFTQQQLATLRTEYAVINTVQPSALPRFHAVLGRMTDAQLEQIIEAGIKFMSRLAINERSRRQGA